MTNINTFQGDVFIHEYIKHSGDENNLFGFSGTDTFKIATAGTDRLTVKADGDVGIGTTTPATKLHVEHYGSQIGDFEGIRIANHATNLHSTARPAYEFVVSDINSGTGIGNGKFAIGYRGNTSASRTDRLVIDNSGNVGIGTTAPGAKVQVGANNETSPQYLWIRGNRVNEAGEICGIHFYNSANSGDRGNSRIINSRGGNNYGSTLSFWTNLAENSPASQKMVIDERGRVGIGTTIPDSGIGHGSQMAMIHLYQQYGVGSPSTILTPCSRILMQKFTGNTSTAHYDQMGLISLNWMPYRSTQGSGYTRFGVGMYSQRTSYAHDDQADMYFFCNNGGNGVDFDAFAIIGNGSSQSIVRVNGSNVTSDDRLKTAETRIENALGSIRKLDPQIYIKHPFLEGSFEKSKDNLNVKLESGLIAQDVWYDAPEFRHLVHIDATGTPTETKPSEPEPGNIRIDPDYSAWGDKPASVNYTGLIPYLIKAVTELSDEHNCHKVTVPVEIYSNVSNYHGLIVSKNTNVNISSVTMDTSVYGVISNVKTDTNNNEILVEASGEGSVWVTNINGNLEAGDYITTSNVAGYGQKQDSEFLANYTVAKITTDCDFNPTTRPVKLVIQRLEDVNYYVHNHTVNISEEEYNQLPENNKTIETRTYHKLGENIVTVEEYNEQESNVNANAYIETITSFCKLRKVEIKDEFPTSNLEIRSEMVNVLDTNGQIQWEDDPSGATEPVYEIRYLDASGNITDEANTVHTAAFVGCTYHCG